MKITSMLVAAILLMSLDAGATFFKYRDSSGAVVITDKLENIPEKYRQRYKVIWDADLEAKDPLARRRAAARESQEIRERERNQRSEAEKKKAGDGKRLVITVDEETGQLIRTLE